MNGGSGGDNLRLHGRNAAGRGEASIVGTADGGSAGPISGSASGGAGSGGGSEAARVVVKATAESAGTGTGHHRSGGSGANGAARRAEIEQAVMRSPGPR